MSTRGNSIESSPYATFVSYLEQGQLAYQRTPSGEAIFFPRVVAPRTGSRELSWHVSRGLGTVYASTAMHAKNQPPLNLVLIDMDEGFRLMSRVEGIPAEQVRIGMRVRFQTAHASEGHPPYPIFVPVERTDD